MIRINANIFVIIELTVVLIVSITDLYECTLDAGAGRDTDIEQLAGNILVLSNVEKEIPTTKRSASNAITSPLPSGLSFMSHNLQYFYFSQSFSHSNCVLGWMIEFESGRPSMQHFSVVFRWQVFHSIFSLETARMRAHILAFRIVKKSIKMHLFSIVNSFSFSFPKLYRNYTLALLLNHGASRMETYTN